MTDQTPGAEPMIPTVTADTEPKMSVVDEIAAERKRQVEAEGWSARHDDQHEEGELALAAMCYAAPDWLREFFTNNDIFIWPWDLTWWKPKNLRRDLIRAAALIVAEIERLDRQVPNDR